MSDETTRFLIDIRIEFSAPPYNDLKSMVYIRRRSDACEILRFVVPPSSPRILWGGEPLKFTTPDGPYVEAPNNIQTTLKFQNGSVEIWNGCELMPGSYAMTNEPAPPAASSEPGPLVAELRARASELTNDDGTLNETGYGYAHCAMIAAEHEARWQAREERLRKTLDSLRKEREEWQEVGRETCLSDREKWNESFGAVNALRCAIELIKEALKEPTT